MPQYTVKYYAGTYSGKRTVDAEDGDEAISKVRTWVRKQMTLSMYADGYRIVDNESCDCEEQEDD